jgi:hypothetical protein
MKRSLRFLLYSIHAHLKTGAVDYEALFRGLTTLQRYFNAEGRRFVAIGTAMLIKGQTRLALTIYTGDKERAVLFFNVNEGKEYNWMTAPGQFLARKTHILVDPGQRQLLVETGRGTLPAEELAKIIEDEARKKPELSTLDLSFTPVAARTFGEKINQMERIQSASVTIARPNFDWSDRYESLAKLADDSQGAAIDTTIRARRGDSLSKDEGLIPSIKQWLSDKLSAVSSAKIKGALRDDGSGLITLKLSDYIETVNVVAEVNPETHQPKESEITEKLNAFLDSRSKTDA